MGGRGSRSSGAGGGGLFAGAGGGGIPIAIPTGPPPNVVPGQPVPAISMQQLQAMTDTEFANYLTGLKSTPIDPLTYYNNNWDTQRLVANMPELNRAPQVVDAQAFASLPGPTLYRTVNTSGSESAIDICGRTMASDVTTIGAGRMGDGFYFANNKSVSQNGYGRTRGNINKTATMQAKLNGNARMVDEDRLNRMLRSESSTVQTAVGRMRSDGQWSKSGIMAYALRKGYNTVRGSDGVINVIDRNAATFSGEVVPWT